MSTIPCVVSLDLARHLRECDRQEGREDRLDALATERYQWLTQDAKGLGEVTESLYQEDAGFPLEEALFALHRAWSRQQPTAEAVRQLLVVLDQKALRMAEQWAREKLRETDEEAAEAAVEAALLRQTD